MPYMQFIRLTIGDGNVNFPRAKCVAEAVLTRHPTQEQRKTAAEQCAHWLFSRARERQRSRVPAENDASMADNSLQNSKNSERRDSRPEKFRATTVRPDGGRGRGHRPGGRLRAARRWS